MGLTGAYLRHFEASIELVFGAGVRGLRMLELGDQVVDDAGIPEETGKAYFTNRGFHHVSVDLNGLHGAVVRDLSRPEQFRDWRGSWDIVTNAGTAEHVEPFDSQYECFSIIHHCLRIGGIAIHLLPDVREHDEHGAWKGHCRYYYSEEFVRTLAEGCGYETLANCLIHGLRCVTLRKTKDAPFMQDRSKLLGSIARRDLPAEGARTFLSRFRAGRLLRRFGSR